MGSPLNSPASEYVINKPGKNMREHRRSISLVRRPWTAESKTAMDYSDYTDRTMMSENSILQNTSLTRPKEPAAPSAKTRVIKAQQPRNTKQTSQKTKLDSSNASIKSKTERKAKASPTTVVPPRGSKSTPAANSSNAVDLYDIVPVRTCSGPEMAGAELGRKNSMRWYYRCKAATPQEIKIALQCVGQRDVEIEKLATIPTAKSQRKNKQSVSVQAKRTPSKLKQTRNSAGMESTFCDCIYEPHPPMKPTLQLFDDAIDVYTETDRDIVYDILQDMIDQVDEILGGEHGDFQDETTLYDRSGSSTTRSTSWDSVYSSVGIDTLYGLEFPDHLQLQFDRASACGSGSNTVIASHRSDEKIHYDEDEIIEELDEQWYVDQWDIDSGAVTVGTMEEVALMRLSRTQHLFADVSSAEVESLASEVKPVKKYRPRHPVAEVERSRRRSSNPSPKPSRIPKPLSRRSSDPAGKQPTPNQQPSIPREVNRPNLPRPPYFRVIKDSASSDSSDFNTAREVRR